MPRSGEGYAGFIVYSSTEYREYIGTILSQPLQANRDYYIEFYASLGDNSTTAINSLGLFLSDTLVLDTNNYNNLMFLPQVQNLDTILTDKNIWKKLYFNYTAIGGERYIVIGNFNSNSNTDTDTISFSSFPVSYYYIDDVNISLIDSIDTISNPPDYSGILITPNPSNGNFILKGNFPSGTKLEIFDLLGQRLSEIEIPQGNQDFPITLSLSDGVYLFQVKDGNTILKSQRIVIEK